VAGVLWLVYALSVTVSGGAPDDCPSVPQVMSAVKGRLPAASLSWQASPVAGGLQLVLRPRSGPQPALQVDLLDDAGQSLLHRLLPGASGGGRGGRMSDCLALAETIALIVDRYVVQVDSPIVPHPQSSEAPQDGAPDQPAPPTPRSTPPSTTDAAVVAGAAWRSGGDALEGFEVLAGIDLQRAARERGAGASLTVGIAPTAEGRWSTGQATLRRIPVRLGTYLSLKAGAGRLEPGLNLGVDALLVNVTESSGTRRTIRNVSPNVEAAFAYRLRGGIYFARGGVAVGLAVPYRLGGLEAQADSAVSTPRTYIRVGLETGIYFR
jgi:hypothetical protein